jgi:predicted nucleotidyltransferase
VKVNTSQHGVSVKTWHKIPLQDKERQAIKEAVKMLKRSFPVSNVILFGSKARGEGDEHSDIDFLLITSRSLLWKEEKAIVEMLFDIGMENDVIFSPLFASSDEWDGGIFMLFPVYDEISRDGAIVA